MKKFLMILTLALSVGLIMCSQPPKADANLDYQLWAKILDTYVDHDGRVNYETLKKNPDDLNTLIGQIEATDLSALNATETKAYWINTYNAVTLKTVVDKYPVKSIRHINFGLVWNIPKKVAQGKKSLGDIEHKVLRPGGDPRIHFAINCASIGCPKLPNKPFYPDTLDRQLDFETKRFINDPEKVRLDRSSNILYVSAILEWFEEDFLVEDPDVLSYVKRYINAEDKNYLENHNVKIEYMDYDWGINKQ